MLNVKNYIDYFAGIWERSSIDFPCFAKCYSKKEQQKREEKFLYFYEKLKAFEERKNRQKDNYQKSTSSYFEIFGNLLIEVFDYSADQIQIILDDSFKDVSKNFFVKGRKFAPELKKEDIYQGLRNVWIMNGLQLMMEIPVEITPSVFAYSMIYPYTDNYLDDPDISDRDKKEFSDRFNRRLYGENIIPNCYIEKQLSKLVSMFEDQFPREQFQGVFTSLYAIQDGQTDSLSLVNCKTDNREIIRDIVLKKGGCSVLADGYLVAGILSEDQEKALFGYGAYLQLLDDLQDVKEDTLAKTKTLFSCMPGKDLDLFVNKTINFGRVAMDELKCFNKTNLDVILQLMNRSIELLMIESVGMNRDFYSSIYLDKLECYSPLRFKFLQELTTRAKSHRYVLFEKFFKDV